MIAYDKLWKTMKEKNISQYKLIKDFRVSRGANRQASQEFKRQHLYLESALQNS